MKSRTIGFAGFQVHVGFESQSPAGPGTVVKFSAVNYARVASARFINSDVVQA